MTTSLIDPPEQIRPELHQAHMNAAFAYAACSRAKRLQTGALIVKHGRPISEGYNGTPAGLDNTCEDPPAEGQVNEGQREVASKSGNGYNPEYASYITRPGVVHAEMNAILALAGSNESARGATLYVTDQPCEICAGAIIQSGISRVVYKRPYRLFTGLDILARRHVPAYQLTDDGALILMNGAFEGYAESRPKKTDVIRRPL